MKKNKNIPLNLKEQINSRIGLICSIVVMILLVFVFHQLDYQIIQKPADQAAKEAEQKKLEAEKAAKAPEISTATVIAVGDNLYHDSLIQSGESDSGTWNYDAIYKNVKDEIQAADIAMVDQETVLTTEHDAVSGYPSFATPTEVGDALINAGFDVIESATNHIDDYGYDYMAQTLNFWKTSYPDVPVLGIHDSAESAGEITTISCKDVTFSLLNYTTTVNNEPYDELPDYAVDLLRTDQVISDIKKAKEISDMTIAFLHTGAEYSTEPDTEEKTFLQLLLHQGVDIAICAHSHTLQNFETLTDDSGHQMLVYYSLGNFISTQKDPVCLLGGMADITIVRDPISDALSIRNADLIPLVTHYNHDQNIYTVYKLSDYTDKLAASHGVHAESTEPFTLETLQEQYKKVLTQDYHTLG